MEPWRRWANGFSCLCFAIVGAPMAIRMRNADFLTSFFLCFLPILVVYYPLLMFGIDRVKAGELPPIAVWIGNLLVTVWGIWLLRRVVRN
jgi:lipopolysaccharide export system permease protein